MFGAMLRDVQIACRSLYKQPVFSGVVLVVLALSSSAAIVIFAIANGVLLKPLGYPNPEQLVALWPDAHVNKLILDEAEKQAIFGSVSGYVPSSFTVNVGGRPERVEGAMVSASHFEVLGRRPLLGRTFGKGEDAPGHRVTVLSYGLWQRLYGGSSDVVGAEMMIDGQPFTVIGVMPADFHDIEERWRIWIPLVVDRSDERDYLSSWFLSLIARLNPEAEVATTGVVLRDLAEKLQERYPNLITDEKVRQAEAVRLWDKITERVRGTLILLLCAVACVLLIASANVANLLLARSIGRKHEFAMRVALGAGRLGLAQQVIVEATLLGAVGVCAGLGITAITMGFIKKWLPASMPRVSEVRVDTSVLVFCVALALFTTFLASLLPAVRATRSLDLSIARFSSAGVVPGNVSWANRCIVISQIALSTLLLIAAGLLARSLWYLQNVDPGFRAEGVITMRLDLTPSDYPGAAEQWSFFARVLGRLKSLPGVEGAGGIHLLPMSSGNWRFPYIVEGHPVVSRDTMTALPDANFRIVTPGYFEVMGIRLVDGRTFSDSDLGKGAAVGIVNQAFADRWWPEGRAVGQRIQLFGEGGPSFSVIGVVSNVLQHSLDGVAEPEIYRPISQWGNASMYVLVRSNLPPHAVYPDIRRAIWSIDDRVPISELSPLSRILYDSVSEDRLISGVVGAFAVLSFVLALSGLYGVLSYGIVQRRRELGIRFALGEQRQRMIIREMVRALWLAVVGLVMGVILSSWATRWLESRLYEIQENDRLTVAVVLLSVTCIAALSSFIPVWRASRLDPISVLRDE